MESSWLSDEGMAVAIVGSRRRVEARFCNPELREEEREIGDLWGWEAAAAT
jgi:hypothetical protein